MDVLEGQSTVIQDWIIMAYAAVRQCGRVNAKGAGLPVAPTARGQVQRGMLHSYGRHLAYCCANTETGHGMTLIPGARDGV